MRTAAVTRLPAGARTIVIVGAGFSGTTVAANLLTQPQVEYLRIVLLDRWRIARGTAYAEREFPYPLNVPAARMSADSTAPLEFLEFARRRMGAVEAEDFLPRTLYGEYLEWKLRCAERLAAPRTQLVRLVGEACALERDDATATFNLELVDGRRLTANQVVLATGTPDPRELPELVTLRGSPAYIHNPWRASRSIGDAASVLLIGSGPTMADIALAVTNSNAGRVKLHALSRHGWLPTSQKAASTREYGLDQELLLEAAAVSVRHLYRVVRDLIDHHQRCGGDWRDAINSVRQCAPRIWHRLALDERRRFLRHLRTLWDVHRHRLPPQSASALDHLRATGRLQMHAGRLVDCEPDGTGICVRWRMRGSSETSRLHVERIINCSGANHSLSDLQQPLWRSLRARGVVSADPLGLGLRTGQHGAVINTAGDPVDNLYYIGPLLQAEHWECTAVPELRARAEALARHLLVRHHAIPQEWAPRLPVLGARVATRLAGHAL